MPQKRPKTRKSVYKRIDLKPTDLIFKTHFSEIFNGLFQYNPNFNVTALNVDRKLSITYNNWQDTTTEFGPHAADRYEPIYAQNQQQ